MTQTSAPRVRRHRLTPPLLGAQDVERPRLSAAIRATPPAGTCVISAPPGYGATTAVAQALDDVAHVAWVSLDEFDSTAAHLTAQLAAALVSHDGPSQGPTPPTDDDVAVALLASLIETLDESPCTWVVLDGVDSEIHAAWLPALAYLIANVPRALRLVITTHDALRRIPADPADRRILLIDRDQLSATEDESTSIALASDPSLDIDTLEGITAAAQGWVAAIRAAARFAAQHPTENATHWLTTEGAGALLEPWLSRLPRERRAFLTDTVFLQRLCAPLCDSVLERSGSQALLEALEGQGRYLSASPPSTREDPVRWWTRHPLLTAALSQESDAIDEPERELRAAAWFETRGDFESTMHHLLAAGRLDDASRYLREHENALFEKGHADRVAAWYATLPPESWGPLGWHLVRVAWGQALGAHPRSADAALAQLRAHLASSPAEGIEQRVLKAEAATLSAYLAALAGDTTTTASSAQSAIDLFCEESPENSPQMAPILLTRALLWEGDVEGASRELGRIKFQPFPTALFREVALTGIKAQFLTDEGRITQARREVTRSLKWLSDHGLTPTEISQFVTLTAEGATCLESGDPRTAAQMLESSAQAAVARYAYGDAAAALIWLARARVCLGSLGDALTSLHQARHLLHESAPTSPILSRIDLAEAFVRHIGGDGVRAERLVQRVPSSDARTLMWARVTMHRQATGVRRSLAAIASAAPRIAIEKQVLLALVAMKRSNTLAEGHLARAADLAGDSGYMLALLGCPSELLDLTASLASRTSHDSLAELVSCARPTDARPLSEPSLAPTGHSHAGPPLSPGEVELIAFLPRRDSNAEIARQLGVSINTVKTRLYRLYRKLGVDNRNDAISVSRSRGLII